MIIKILIIFIFFLNTSCSLDKVVKHHGVHFLEKKQENLRISNTNKNDARKLLGPPSTESIFDNEIWIYIERKTTVSQLSSFGKKKLLANNVLILEFNDRGILIKKDFYDKNQMKSLQLTKETTNVLNRKDSFIRSVLTSLRYKINDPLGKRRPK